MMATLSFAATVKNLIQALKNEERADLSSLSRGNPNYHHRRTTPAASEHMSYGTVETPGLGSTITQRYYFPNDLKQNSSSAIKDKVEEIIIIDSDDSDCDVKQSGDKYVEQKCSSGTDINMGNFPSDFNSVDGQSISFSMQGNCNFLMTVSTPTVNSTAIQNLSGDSLLDLNETVVPGESINSNLSYICSPKNETSGLGNSSLATNETQKSTKELNGNKRSCAFCSKTFASSQCSQIHSKFHCPFQKKYKVFCKLCGLNCGNPYKAGKHVKKKHHVIGYTKVKSLIFFKPPDPDDPLSENISSASALLSINKVTKLAISSSSDKLAPSRPNSGGEREKFKRSQNCMKIKTKTSRGRIPCRYCKREMSSNVALSIHLAYHCPVQKMYKLMCKICGKIYAGRTGVNRHLIRKHNVKEITGQNPCEFVIKVKNDDNSSLITEETNPPLLRKSYKEKSASPDSFIINNIVDTGENILAKQSITHNSFECITHNSFKYLSRKDRSCIFCGKTFSSLYRLQTHNKFHCQFQEKVKLFCKLCGLKFSRPDLLGRHIKIMHGINEAIKLKSVLSHSNLVSAAEDSTKYPAKRISRVKNEVRSFQCKYCQLEFSESYNLNRHLKYNCPFQKSHEMVCKKCGIRYAGENGIHRHLFRDHGVQNTAWKLHYAVVKIKNQLTDDRTECQMNSSSINDASTCKISKENFKCTYCFRIFTKRRYLGSHLRFCRNNRNQSIPTFLKVKQKSPSVLGMNKLLGKCGLCNSKFHNTDQIKKHCLSAHIKSKIICQLCEESYDSYVVFKKHVKLLDGKYVCGNCGSLKMLQEKTITEECSTPAENVDSAMDSISCNVCEKEFLSVVLLMQHLQEHLL